MFSIFKITKELFTQRLVVYTIAIFIAIVLFNTTYMSLGTIVPILVIGLGLVVFSITPSKSKASVSSKFFIWMSVLILLATLVSGGDNYRDCFKLFLVTVFVYYSTKLVLSHSEVKILSLLLTISYVIYAFLVLQSIGGETNYFGRAQIKILNSDIPLDPNVVSAVFVLPLIISIYNLLYGRYKLLAILLAIVFFVAIVVLGSRGAFLGLSLSIIVLLSEYLFSRKTSLFVKLLFGGCIVVVVSYVVLFLNNLDNIMGLNRILDFSSDDLSEGNGRTGVWFERLELLLSSPIWGYGANNDVGMLHKGMASHNTIIQVLHYGGIIGFTLFMIPIMRLYKRKSLSKSIKLALFLSVFVPIFFIDTLQERTLWNFIIFYSLLSTQENASDCLLWDFKRL